ncbi:MAG TPA: hypothetical protein VFF32_15235 [Dermatophilaceae bacterium]|nr:hypothetical protein [Dermatophilaceae bacterium]
MRVKLRLVLGVAAIWLAAVAGVSATAWLAIDRAGQGVTSASVSALPAVLISTATRTTAPDQGASSTGPTTKPSASKTSTASPSPSSASTHTGSASSIPVRDRTVTVVGGQVSVRCIGSALTLRIAQPDNGWRVELDRSDSGDVQVTFKGGDHEASQETQVTATCSAGTPAFTVDNKNSGDT